MGPFRRPDKKTIKQFESLTRRFNQNKRLKKNGWFKTLVVTYLFLAAIFVIGASSVSNWWYLAGAVFFLLYWAWRAYETVTRNRYHNLIGEHNFYMVSPDEGDPGETMLFVEHKLSGDNCVFPLGEISGITCSITREIWKKETWTSFNKQFCEISIEFPVVYNCENPERRARTQLQANFVFVVNGGRAETHEFALDNMNGVLVQTRKTIRQLLEQLIMDVFAVRKNHFRGNASIMAEARDKLLGYRENSRRGVKTVLASQPLLTHRLSLESLSITGSVEIRAEACMC
jgi:hypothetical protein